MIHILTDTEALAALGMSAASEIPDLDMLLSAVDDGINSETGHDWLAGDAEIDPTAKLAARIALIALYDGLPMPDTYQYKIGQLHAKALEMVV